MLRKQKDGKQKPWTIENLKSGLEHFYNEHQRYPTAPEVDKYPYLPSARSIERRFGGLVALRTKLKLKSQTDFRSGAHSSARANKINHRAHIVEDKVYKFLITKFKKEFVHREFFFTDDKRTRADFFVYDQKGGFCVDVFYPSDRRNLAGCLNSKLDKYENPVMSQYPMIFLQMNEDIGPEILEKLIQNKKKELKSGQLLMEWKSFQDFCSTRKSLKIGREGV
ncbi:MAG: hypothetical protein AAB726_00100 [Patescibacteria group bacterium]